jgi:hypothetical protein
LACKDGNVAVLGSRLHLKNYDVATTVDNDEGGADDAANIERVIYSIAKLPVTASYKEVTVSISKMAKRDVLALLKAEKVPCCEATELLDVDR